MKQKTKKILKEFLKLKLIEIGMVMGCILFFALLIWMVSQDNFLSIIAIIIFVMLVIVVFGSIIFSFIYANWDEAKRIVRENSKTIKNER